MNGLCPCPFQSVSPIFLGAFCKAMENSLSKSLTCFHCVMFGCAPNPDSTSCFSFQSGYSDRSPFHPLLKFNPPLTVNMSCFGPLVFHPHERKLLTTSQQCAYIAKRSLPGTLCNHTTCFPSVGVDRWRHS